jgi:hypothetical protein
MNYHEKLFKSELRIYKVSILVRFWSDFDYKLEIQLMNENGQKLGEVIKRTINQLEYNNFKTNKCLDKVAKQCIEDYEDWSVEKWEE